MHSKARREEEREREGNGRAVEEREGRRAVNSYITLTHNTERREMRMECLF